MIMQSLLRHAMAEAISEGFINCLIVTSSAEANIQLTRIHEHIFARKYFVMLLTIARFAFRLLISTPSPPSLLLPLKSVLLSPYPIIHHNTENQNTHETHFHSFLLVRGLYS